MAKLETIAEILVDEIEKFQVSVKEFKLESDKLRTTPLSINTSVIKNTLGDFIEELKTNQLKQNEDLKLLNKQIRKALVIPKWMVGVYVFLFVALMSSIILNFNFSYKNSKIEKEALQKGKNIITNQIQEFFQVNPKASKSYNVWYKSKS